MARRSPHPSRNGLMGCAFPCGSALSVFNPKGEVIWPNDHRATSEGMMRGIISWSLQFRFIVLIAAVLVIFAGIRNLLEIPVDVLPEFAPPFVEVQMEALGLNTNEVESLVTLNLEEILNGTPWVQSVRSTTVPGMVSVTLFFEPGTEILNARQLVQERLHLAALLPNIAKPPQILQPLSATSRVMMVGLSSKNLSEVELGVLARWKIRPGPHGRARRRERDDVGPS